MMVRCPQNASALGFQHFIASLWGALRYSRRYSTHHSSPLTTRRDSVARGPRTGGLVRLRAPVGVRRPRRAIGKKRWRTFEVAA
jgi:hypothetical protein